MTATGQPRQARIGISGSYGGFNLGDEAILQSMVAQVRRTMPAEITVFSRNADDTRRRHRVERVVAVRDITRRESRQILEGLDLLLLGGGGILYDSDAETYLREVFIAHEAGIPVMLYAASAGPLRDPSVRAVARDALNRADIVTVRDRPSRQLLEEIGVDREIVVTADPAILLEPEPLTLDEILRAEAIDPTSPLIGLSVREPGPAAPDLDVEHYYRLVANAADFMIARLDAEVVFFPLERRMFDVQHSHGVVSRMRFAQCATVLKRDYSPGQVVSLLKHFDFAVGMRLHFLIFSALAGVPFVALPYATKVSGFLEELQLEEYPVLEHVSAGQLIAMIDRSWDTRDDLRAHIQENVGMLQARARQNNDLMAQLLHGSIRTSEDRSSVPKGEV
jgi:polysaccharide pyruvyl transferase CsaB